MQGIPAVKAVWQGQLVAEFSGAIPEEQARAVRHRAGRGDHRRRGARRRRRRGPPSAEDPRLDAAEAALERGDLAAAEAAYQSILDAEPDHPEAGLALKQVQLFRRAEEAGPDALAAADAAPDDVAAQTRAADFLLGTGNVEAAFERLLDVVPRTAGEDRDLARTHLVELFAVVGNDDPRVGAARRAADGRPVLRDPAAAGQATGRCRRPGRRCRKPARKAPTSWKPVVETSGSTRGSAP